MTKLQKGITLYGLTMVAIGSCIASGIFVVPGQVARDLFHPGWILAIWTVGGVIALTGALTFAELGGLFPKAGGVYVFLKEGYSEVVGFLYGWVYLLVVNTGALAALGLALAEYLTYFIPLSGNGKVVLATTVVVGLTAMNMLGIKLGQLFINIFTSLKLIAIAAIVVAGMAYFLFTPAENATNFSAFQTPDNLIGALLLALIGVFWSFGGWHHASYLAGETINAKRNVPRAMIIGTLVVTVTYLLVNLAYMFLLPLGDIATSERVAGEAVSTLVPFGGKLVAVVISISIFGSIGIYTMTAPRIYFAMARDKIFFEKLAYIHPKYKTPVYAMALQAFWATVLLWFWGTFENLIIYVTFMDLMFMMMAGASIFIFRRKLADEPRPYKTNGYPIVPAIYVLVTMAFVISTFVQRPTQAIAGIIVAAAGLLVYTYFKRKNKNSQAWEDNVIDQPISDYLDDEV
ncbi:MAG: amino acid permease [Bacteroidota bacterium]